VEIAASGVDPRTIGCVSDRGQLVAVGEILIAKCDPEHPLAYQGHHLMLDQLLSPHVAEAHSQA
jgi:hypothetical protein